MRWKTPARIAAVPWGLATWMVAPCTARCTDGLTMPEADLELPDLTNLCDRSPPEFKRAESGFN